MYTATIYIGNTTIEVDTTWKEGMALAFNLWYEGKGRIGNNCLGAIVGVNEADDGIDIIVDTKERYDDELIFVCHIKNKNDEDKLPQYDFFRFS